MLKGFIRKSFGIFFYLTIIKGESIIKDDKGGDNH